MTQNKPWWAAPSPKIHTVIFLILFNLLYIASPMQYQHFLLWSLLRKILILSLKYPESQKTEFDPSYFPIILENNFFKSKFVWVKKNMRSMMTKYAWNIFKQKFIITEVPVLHKNWIDISQVLQFDIRLLFFELLIKNCFF